MPAQPPRPILVGMRRRRASGLLHLVGGQKAQDRHEGSNQHSVDSESYLHTPPDYGYMILPTKVCYQDCWLGETSTP